MLSDGSFCIGYKVLPMHVKTLVSLMEQHSPGVLRGVLPVCEPVWPADSSNRPCRPLPSSVPDWPVLLLVFPALPPVSPGRRPGSPGCRSPSPARQLLSPARQPVSPARRAVSPARRAVSPAHRLASPIR
ncbi:hypothetical protein PENSPDRAFT_282549 [Peniophora sp. CONT]|nr:hypothetical protein PENSPDRAFT_282549 [Peniophora sp. CONT]